MKNQKGFSLIELLIVVVIIGIIAAIAIPNLLASRRAANEGSAVSTLRTIHGGQFTYQATKGDGNFGDLPALAGERIVDDSLGTEGATKSGYIFATIKFDAVKGTNPASFAARAIPSSLQGVTATGTRVFGIATDGVLAAHVWDDSSVAQVHLTGDALAGATYGGGVAMGN